MENSRTQNKAKHVHNPQYIVLEIPDGNKSNPSSKVTTIYPHFYFILHICTQNQQNLLSLVNRCDMLKAWTLRKHPYFLISCDIRHRLRGSGWLEKSHVMSSVLAVLEHSVVPGHLAAGMRWPWTLRANPGSRSCTSASNKNPCHKTTSTASLDRFQRTSAHSAFLPQTGCWTGNQGPAYEERVLIN